MPASLGCTRARAGAEATEATLPASLARPRNPQRQAGKEAANWRCPFKKGEGAAAHSRDESAAAGAHGSGQ